MCNKVSIENSREYEVYFNKELGREEVREKQVAKSSWDDKYLFELEVSLEEEFCL